jgi:hypothetical protein
MTAVALVVAATLAVLCVLYVARPFLRNPEPPSDVLPAPDELEQRRLKLIEERDRALDALRELEFDHRTGKLSDGDYRALVGPLRRRAANASRALEPRGKERQRERAAG